MFLMLFFVNCHFLFDGYPKTVWVHYKTATDAKDAIKLHNFRHVRVSSIVPTVTIWQFDGYTDDNIRFIIGTLAKNDKVVKIESEL